MAIITLTTDMGGRDYYVAAVKGIIYNIVPEIQLVDISHHVSPFDIAQASFILRNAYPNFPAGTVHIIGVNPERVKRKDAFDMREETLHVIVQYEGQYFIGADNGIFSLLFDKQPEKIFEITLDTGSDSTTFPTRDIFAKIACLLSSGMSLEEIGVPLESLKERSIFRPVAEENTIKGTVIYIDSYGNVITNITRSHFINTGKGRNFSIYFRREDYDISEISHSYSDVPEGEKVALFGSSGYLEIAINKGVEGSGGGASSLFGLKVNDSIRVEFEP